MKKWTKFLETCSSLHRTGQPDAARCSSLSCNRSRPNPQRIIIWVLQSQPVHCRRAESHHECAYRKREHETEKSSKREQGAASLPHADGWKLLEASESCRQPHCQQLSRTAFSPVRPSTQKRCLISQRSSETKRHCHQPRKCRTKPVRSQLG